MNKPDDKADPCPDPQGCFERFCTGMFALLLMLVELATLCHLSGCQGVADHASHQHGLVLYGGVDGRVGIGYGEIEHVPHGSVYLRQIYQSSPSFLWQRPGTNVTATVTFWDTRCATNSLFDAQAVATNRPERAAR